MITADQARRALQALDGLKMSRRAREALRAVLQEAVKGDTEGIGEMLVQMDNSTRKQVLEIAVGVQTLTEARLARAAEALDALGDWDALVAEAAVDGERDE